MPVAGVDVGSVAAKAVVLDEKKKIVLGRAVLPTGWNSREAGEQVLQAAVPREWSRRPCGVWSARAMAAWPCPLPTRS